MNNDTREIDGVRIVHVRGPAMASVSGVADPDGEITAGVYMDQSFTSCSPLTTIKRMDDLVNSVERELSKISKAKGMGFAVILWQIPPVLERMEDCVDPKDSTVIAGYKMRGRFTTIPHMSNNELSRCGIDNFDNPNHITGD